jgi:hypothetical protein
VYHPVAAITASQNTAQQHHWHFGKLACRVPVAQCYSKLLSLTFWMAVPQYDKAAKEEERKLKHAPGWEKQAEKQAQDKTAGKTLS